MPDRADDQLDTLIEVVAGDDLIIHDRGDRERRARLIVLAFAKNGLSATSGVGGASAARKADRGPPEEQQANQAKRIKRLVTLSDQAAGLKAAGHSSPRLPEPSSVPQPARKLAKFAWRRKRKARSRTMN